MANVSIEIEVLSHAINPAEHNVEADRDNLFQLNTTDSAYGTDLPAFSTTVYTFYAAQVAVANTYSVELRYKLWSGGTTAGGGTNTEDGVLGQPTAAADITAELTAKIQNNLARH